MKIETSDGSPVAVPISSIEVNQVFRYPTGSALYLITNHVTSYGRMAVNLANGSTMFVTESKLVVRIKNIKVVVDDPFYTVGE